MNMPTEAKIGLEWATANSETMVALRSDGVSDGGHSVDVMKKAGASSIKV
jgi:hypothetical protein